MDQPTNSTAIALQMEKHPRELYYISFSSMWDSFSFYGMKALLIAYIVTQLRMGQPMGYAILGTYAAFVFGFSFAGGIIADKYLGTRKSIIWGNYLQIAGHLTLALPFAQPFFAGLALIATGSGFRGSTSGSLLGTFYAHRDARKKDDGYALYYMLFNMGAALGGLLCGYLGQNINWHVGFGAACLFMIVGQLQFILGIKKHQGLPPDLSKLKEKVFFNWLDRETLIYLLSLVVVGTVVEILQHPAAMNVIMLPVAALSFLYVFYLSFRFTQAERRKLFAAMVLLLLTSLFWACYEQCSGSLSLFVLHNVNLHLLGFQLSGLSINSFTPAAWLVVLTPLSIKVWDWLHKRKINPRTYIKFLIAFVFLATCFLILWTGCMFHRESGMMPVILLILAYAFLELGEICIGPVAYSLASNLSPKAIVSTLMGVMYLSVSLGEFLSGKLGSLMEFPSGLTNPVQMMPYFSNVFVKIAGGALLIALGIGMLIPILKKWMQEVR